MSYNPKALEEYTRRLQNQILDLEEEFVDLLGEDGAYHKDVPDAVAMRARMLERSFGKVMSNITSMKWAINHTK